MIPIISFDNLKEATFLERLNRFLVALDYKNSLLKCHLHDPGRLHELLIRGSKVLILFTKNPSRKTSCDIIAINNGDEWIFVHSGYHSMIARELLKRKLIPELSLFNKIIPEYKIGDSRIDFLLINERKMLLEVKGCTLFIDNIGYFPDAPTLRGTRHINELAKAIDLGYDSGVLFLVMSDRILKVKPNAGTDKKFTEVVQRAYNKSVKFYAYTFHFTNNTLFAVKQIPVEI